jgi:hypothetical protein
VVSLRNPRTLAPHHRRRLALAAVAVASLLLPLLQTPAGAAGPGCVDPPSVVDDPSAVPAHTPGTGYTTIDGASPTTFDVDVLGVIPDGIMLDVDLIVARITGPQQFLDDAGGIFYGMSGSPVYINGNKDTGDLLGAVSYSYWADQTILGLTPATAMLDLFDLPTSSAPSFAARVPMTTSMRRRVSAAGIALAEPASLEQMPTLLAVPVQGKRLRQLRRMIHDRHSDLRVVAAGGAGGAALPVSGNAFGVGEPVSSIVSYGDASIWAAGTVSIVCSDGVNDDQIAMYGHSLFYDTPGPVTLGLNGVNVLGISHNEAWWNDMIPVVTDVRGSVTADRFVGEVGEVGLAPQAFPITSDFTSPDTGLERIGSSDSVYQGSYFFEYAAWLHMIQNLDNVFQRISPGTSNLGWTLDLQGPDGTPYTIQNRVHAYSSWDATEGIWKLISEIDALSYGGFGNITFTGLDATGSITSANETGVITRVRTSTGLNEALRERPVTEVRSGARVTIEVTQTPAGGGSNVVTSFRIKVPKRWHGLHRVTVRGGYDRWWGGDAETLAQLVRSLNGGEQADDLIVQGIGAKVAQTSSLIVDGGARFLLDVR